MIKLKQLIQKQESPKILVTKKDGSSIVPYEITMKWYNKHKNEYDVVKDKKSSVGQIGLKNYYSYNAQMAKSMQDKLFFLNHPKIQDSKLFLDYGSADGSTLQYMKKAGVDAQLVGYDIDPDMNAVAKKKNPNIDFFDKLPKIPKQKNASVVMSSIWHEIFSYMKPQEITHAMKELKEKVNPKYIIIRDMVPPELSNANLNKVKKLADAINSSKDPDHVKVRNDLFEDGKAKTAKDVAMFILKYRYLDKGNWDRESKQNYLSSNIDKVMQTLKKGGFNPKLVSYKTKKLDYIDDKTKETFGVEYPFDTHYYAIIKLR